MSMSDTFVCLSRSDLRLVRRLAVSLCTVVFAASTVLAQDNQNEKRGFDAESLYSVGEIRRQGSMEKTDYLRASG